MRLADPGTRSGRETVRPTNDPCQPVDSPATASHGKERLA
jgi:hypothetical protein